jgi:para-aminobenzoate synthetase component 1
VPDYVPLIREISPPTSTMAAFEKIAGRPGAVLLESGTREPKLGRWSFLACDPFLVFRSKGTRIEVTVISEESKSRKSPFRLLDSSTPRHIMEGDPFLVLRDLLADCRVARPAATPPLLAGAIGYFGYDLGRFVERIPDQTIDDVPVADCHLGFYASVAAIDHVANRAWVCAIGAPESGRAADRLAEKRVEELAQAIAGQPHPPSPSPRAERGRQSSRMETWESRGEVRPTPRLLDSSTPLQVTSNFTHGAYLAAVRRAKDYIAAGDIYQVNLSQRLSAPLATPPMSLYARLTGQNPAPFSGYFETPDAAVVCCSPERFLQVRSGEVETRPIKGTRPRGATPDEDARLAAELLASEKDRAENVMIVDLERNDLGRVCEFGSVHVPELFALESYATVHHLVSTVRGRLRPGAAALDCLRASFPGGSITGAPKVRSMEIIEEIEPTRRGIYTGAIGYLCFSGDMDVNIVIRTLVVKGQTAYFQVGGAIVADSDPQAEYEETLDKARALARGLAAEAGTEAIRWPE